VHIEGWCGVEHVFITIMQDEVRILLGLPMYINATELIDCRVINIARVVLILSH
jgi:hypothetical protein